jgi:hypothetical protein
LALVAQAALLLATPGWMEVIPYFHQLLQLVVGKAKLAIPRPDQAVRAAVAAHCCIG